MIVIVYLWPGGLRSASASISGPDSYKKMKFEAGVHRVQRVPKTEKQGRMHTSTMTVAVLPQPTEVQFSSIYRWMKWHEMDENEKNEMDGLHSHSLCISLVFLLLLKH